MKMYFFSIIFFGFFFCSHVYSQQNYEPVYGNPLNEPWRWTHFDELIGKGVRCISETADGNMVFGLSKGLVFYDGIVWKEQNEENGFVDDAVTQLEYSEDKLLYAGTEKGLYEYNGREWNKIFPQGNQPGNLDIEHIICLTKLKGGGIVASFGADQYKGLLFYNHGCYEILASQKTINGLNLSGETKICSISEEWCIDSVFCIQDVFQDTHNRFWVWESKGGEEGHVFYFEKNEDKIKYSKLFTSEDGLMKGREAKFAEDGHGNIWVINASFHKGMSVFDGKSWENITLKGENSYLSIKHVEGTVWIGGFSVLYSYKNGKWETYKRPLIPIPTYKIFVYSDSRGYLWVYGIKGEVARIDYMGKRWNSIKSLNYHCEDQSGNMWFIAVDGRVVVKNSDHWYSYDYSNGLPDVPVKVFCTKEGLICVAGSHNEQACLSYFNGSVWKRLLFPKLSWGIDYRAVYEDNENNLWMGCSVNFFQGKGQRGGVIKIQNLGKWSQMTTHYRPEHGITMSSSYGFAQTKDGSMWLGGAHLIRYQNGKWTQYSEIESLNNYINTMGNTPDGTLWVGSRRFGVFQFKDNNWSVYNIDNCLKSNSIISILPVHKNNVWIATNSDFSRFDGTTWATELFHDELTLSQENGGLRRQKDGTLWINRASRTWKRRAIHDNFVEKDDEEYFSAISYSTNKLAPETKIVLFSEEVSSLGNTYIEWEGFDNWNETPSSKLQYSYHLNNEEWSNFSKKCNVTLLNLKKGSYLFEVRARDIDFNVDPTPTQISFKVLPPIWKQTWFILLISAYIFVVIIYLIVIYIQKKNLEKLNLELTKHGKEIERKNITLQKQKEQILQQTIGEQERNQSKIRFFTNISHEFRTPLTLIIGIIDNLTGKVLKEEPGYCEEQLRVVKKNTHQLLHLINQLMDFRKLDSNSIELSISEIEAVGYIKDICSLFRTFAKKYRIDLRFDCDLEKLTSWLDMDKLEKILFNLISNAIKFTPEEGEISVKFRKIELSDANYMEVIVEDTGKGIPENRSAAIFKPFYQIDDLEKRSNVDSTGIGLSIVYNYTKLHRGKVQVVSSIDPKVQLQRGYSTRFILHLPIEKSAYSQKEINEYMKESKFVEKSVFIEKNTDKKLNVDYNLEVLGKRTVPHILIVEDNTDLRHYMVDSLKKHFKVVEACNGGEGYDLTVSVLPDLIISDIMMPEMSGSEMCDKIKNDVRTSHIPIILLSALTTNENKIEGLQKGADDYITKPFNFEMLFARINNILSSRSKLRQKIKNDEVINPDEEEVVSMDTALLKKLKSILEENYNNPQFNVEDLSSHIGISNRHLRHKLKILVNMSPVEYIKVFRLQKAAPLLLGNKGSISEIAYGTGFNDLSYFGKCFSKHFGMNPSEYIKTYKKPNEVLHLS